MDDNNNAILIDFGLSRVLNEEGFATFEGTGTARFAAIELLNSEDAKITPASDVWSLSMLIYEVQKYKSIQLRILTFICYFPQGAVGEEAV